MTSPPGAEAATELDSLGINLRAQGAWVPDEDLGRAIIAAFAKGHTAEGIHEVLEGKGIPASAKMIVGYLRKAGVDTSVNVRQRVALALRDAAKKSS